MRYLVDPSHVRLDAGAWFFLFVTCVLMPVVAVRQHGQLSAETPIVTRLQIYGSAVAIHAFLLLMVWLVVRSQHLDLFPRYRLSAGHVVIGLIALALGLLPVLERFRSKDAIAHARTLMMAPRTPREYVLFYAVSISAGVAEQLAYRGVLFTLLAALFGAWWLSAMVSAAVFGVVHVFQGWKSAGIAALIGLRDQIVVGLTGTLVVAIVIHTLHDVIAGTVIGVRVRRESATSVEPA